MYRLIDSLCRSATAAALAVAAIIVIANPANAEGYGGFQAYLVDMQPNEILSVRRGPNATDEKLGALPSDAENIHVIWCNKYDGQSWCDISWKDLRGWVTGGHLQNVEGGY